MSGVKRLPFPDGKPYNIVPLGVAAGGGEVVVDVEDYPHMLVAGMSGSGKSVMLRNVLLHCLQASEWRVILLDPKRAELSMYRDAENVVEVATELDAMVETVAKVETMMHARYAEMEEAGVNHFLSLPDPPPAVMLMVDEVFPLFVSAGGGEADVLCARAVSLVGSVVRLGRAAGVHVVLSTQRPDGRVIPSGIVDDLGCRVDLGGAGARLDPGGGVVRLGGECVEFRGYFVPFEELGECVAVCNSLL